MLVGIASGDWLHPNKARDKREHWGGSGWARIGQYVTSLPMPVAVGTLVWNRTHFSIQDHVGNMYDPDVVLMQRLMHRGIGDNIPRAQAQGQVIVNDVDDWYWGLSPANKAFHVNHPKNNPDENINHYRQTLSRSDLLIVSTPYLAHRLTSLVNVRTEVVKNHIDVESFIVKEHTDSTQPVVGWVGSTAHRSGDLETMRGLLNPMSRNGLIKLYHGGDAPNTPTFATRLGLKEFEVETSPLTPIEDYPKLMTMDIGIVPLANNPFNRAKSDIKGLEYAASGIPFIAQNMDAYIDLQHSLGVGRVAKNPTKWIRHIEQLRNPQVRKEEGAKNRELVFARDRKKGVKELAELLSSL